MASHAFLRAHLNPQLVFGSPCHEDGGATNRIDATGGSVSGNNQLLERPRRCATSSLHFSSGKFSRVFKLNVYTLNQKEGKRYRIDSDLGAWECDRWHELAKGGGVGWGILGSHLLLACYLVTFMNEKSLEFWEHG